MWKVKQVSTELSKGKFYQPLMLDIKNFEEGVKALAKGQDLLAAFTTRLKKNEEDLETARQFMTQRSLNGRHHSSSALLQLAESWHSHLEVMEKGNKEMLEEMLRLSKAGDGDAMMEDGKSFCPI